MAKKGVKAKTHGAKPQKSPVTSEREKIFTTQDLDALRRRTYYMRRRLPAIAGCAIDIESPKKRDAVAQAWRAMIVAQHLQARGDIPGNAAATIFGDAAWIIATAAHNLVDKRIRDVFADTPMGRFVAGVLMTIGEEDLARLALNDWVAYALRWESGREWIKENAV